MSNPNPEKIPAKNNIKVKDLTPGDVVSLPLSDLHAVYVEQTQHPVYKNLQLVIWRQGNPWGTRGKWFHDALSSDQVVGNTWATNEKDLEKALRWALGL